MYRVYYVLFPLFSSVTPSGIFSDQSSMSNQKSTLAMLWSMDIWIYQHILHITELVFGNLCFNNYKDFIVLMFHSDGCWDVGRLTHMLLDTYPSINREKCFRRSAVTHCRLFWDNFMIDFWLEGSAPEKGLNLDEWIVKSLNIPHAITSLLHIYQL